MFRFAKILRISEEYIEAKNLCIKKELAVEKRKIK